LRTTLALAAIGLAVITTPRANAGLVLELKPSDFNATDKKWPIANGSILPSGAGSDYFACATFHATPALTSKVNTTNGLGYSAVDFTAAGTILGGPLCPDSLGGANPKTIEAWCFQPTGANGDAQTIIDLSRQYGAENSNFGFSNAGYGQAVQSSPNTVNWTAGNSVRQGNWVHLVASYDGTTLNLYVNGALDKSVAHTYATETGGSISIGCMRWGKATTAHSTDNEDGWNNWKGYLGSIRVYDEARTADQVSTAYGLGVNYGEQGTGLPKINASVSGTGGSITPLGDTFVAIHASQSYTITTTYGYQLSSVLVDGTNAPDAVTSGSYTFSDVTTDHTIVVAWTPRPEITGTVSGPDGPIYSAFVSLSANSDGSSPSDIRQSDASGNYAITPPANGTYYLIARKGSFVTSSILTAVMSGSTVSGQNFTLEKSTGLDPLVYLDAATLSAGALTSWPNTGSLGGTIDKPASAAAPTVETLDGKAAVTFDGSTTFLRASFASPAQITGQSDWSVAYWVYNPSFTGDEYPFGWARIGTPGRGANFGIGNYWRAVDHNDGAYQIYFFPFPVAGAWQHVAVTYDGSTEKLYLNGVLNQTASNRTLNIYPSDYLTLGTGVQWDGTYLDWAKFSGSINSLAIYDQALTQTEVEGLLVTAPPADPYTTWINSTAFNTPTPLSEAQKLPGADPDGDGMTNFQEYAFGLNPTSATSVNPITVPLNKSSGTFSYTRSSDSGLTYTVWHSTDLEHWYSTGATQGAATANGGGVETVPVTLDPSLRSELKLFVRVTAQ